MREIERRDTGRNPNGNVKLTNSRVGWHGVYGPTLLRSPELDNQFDHETLVNMGDIVIATGNWGKHLTADKFIRNELQTIIIQNLEKKGEMSREKFEEEFQKGVKFVENSGFTGAWQYDNEVDITSDEIQESQAQKVAASLMRVAQARNWDGFEAIAIASVSTRLEVKERVKEILNEKNISVNQVVLYGLACAGATQAMCDFARREDLWGTQCAVSGIESLSGSRMGTSSYTTKWTFGNGIGTTAFIPRVEIEHIAGSTLVIKDTRMMRIPRLYDIENIPEHLKLDKAQWPSHYTFANEASRENIAFLSDGSVLMNMHTDFDEDGKPRNDVVAQVSGMATFRFFGTYTPNHIISVTEEQFRNSTDERLLEALLGNYLNPSIMHQPTEHVFIGIGNQYETLRNRSGNSQIHKITRLWLMRKTGANNMSAATSFFQFSRLIEENLLQKGVVTPVIGFGIGGSIHVDFIEIH